MSLKEEIINFLKAKNDWVHGGDIEALAFSLGYLSSNGGRRARELANSGLIEKELRNGSVWYRCRNESQIVRELREIRERSEREKEGERLKKEPINYTAKLF